MDGVTEIVPVIAAAVALVAVNAGTCPVPLAAKPMAVFVLVQAKVAPAGVLVIAPIGIAVPEHTVMFAGAVITGNGFTVMV
jgi:hypothetical protein